jgi:hypothetical protein
MAVKKVLFYWFLDIVGAAVPDADENQDEDENLCPAL